MDANHEPAAPTDVPTDALREVWFRRIETVHQAAAGDSGLECASLCTGRCCPQAMASRDPDYQVGHVAIMLPFEFEYLVARTGVASPAFQRAPLELTEDVSIDVGFITTDSRCPFLTADFRCGIHDIRPLDCRSFPVIPVFGADGTLTFRFDNDCPSLRTLATSHRESLMAAWRGILDYLPMTYRSLYNRL